ncbi:MAG: hypothetical protein ACOX6V_05325 [Patescibacteria group bacterium]
MNLKLKKNPNLKELVGLFFEENKLQKEQLRTYVLQQLTTIRKEFDYYLHTPNMSDLWNQVGNLSSFTTNRTYQDACRRVLNLTNEIDFWIKECVSSEQHLEFFILSKASELNSGDKDRDYYNALLIRHDQLLAVTEVFKTALDNLKACSKLPSNCIIHSKEFEYFIEKDLKTRIFELAEEFYVTRKELGKV